MWRCCSTAAGPPPLPLLLWLQVTSEYNTDEEEEGAATPRTPRSAAPLAAAAVAELAGTGRQDASGITREAVGAAEVTDIFPSFSSRPGAAAAAQAAGEAPLSTSPARPRKSLQIATKPRDTSRHIDTGAAARTSEPAAWDSWAPTHA